MFYCVLPWTVDTVDTRSDTQSDHDERTHTMAAVSEAQALALAAALEKAEAEYAEQGFVNVETHEEIEANKYDC